MRLFKKVSIAALATLIVDVASALTVFIINLFSINHEGYRRFFWDSLYVKAQNKSATSTIIQFGYTGTYWYATVFNICLLLGMFAIVTVIYWLPDKRQSLSKNTGHK